MEVILQSDIPKLGKKYSIVKVKNGYGSNYLIPQGFAVLANKTNKKIALENNRQAEYKLSRFKEVAEAAAYQLQESSPVLFVKASENGKIFGSVTPLQIANLLRQNKIKVENNQVTILQPVKELGRHEAKVNLGYGVETIFTFEVKNEE